MRFWSTSVISRSVPWAPRFGLLWTVTVNQGPHFMIRLMNCSLQKDTLQDDRPIKLLGYHQTLFRIWKWIIQWFENWCLGKSPYLILWQHFTQASSLWASLSWLSYRFSTTSSSGNPSDDQVTVLSVLTEDPFLLQAQTKSFRLETQWALTLQEAVILIKNQSVFAEFLKPILVILRSKKLIRLWPTSPPMLQESTNFY